jgi:antitoxin (DNA-binding transcriptional repressor) of toxin-antitoxin stability system
MTTISQRELRNDSGAILRAIEAGESMIVTKSGIPVAELRPLTRRRFVPAQEWARQVAHHLPVDAARLRADIDVAADQEVGDPFARRSTSKGASG